MSHFLSHSYQYHIGSYQGWDAIDWDCNQLGLHAGNPDWDWEPQYQSIAKSDLQSQSIANLDAQSQSIANSDLQSQSIANHNLQSQSIGNQNSAIPIDCKKIQSQAIQ